MIVYRKEQFIRSAVPSALPYEAILGAAEEWGYIDENVAQRTKLPRRQYGPERVVLTPAQVRKLAAALNEPARSVTSLLVLTGLRIGELLALRWGSIDLNARLLRVCETVYDGNFDQPKTKRSARTIPIGTETAEILAALRPAAVDPKALVFATREGLPLARWNLLRKHFTREIYLHAIPEEQRRAVERVERLVFGPKCTQVQAPAQAEAGRVN